LNGTDIDLRNGLEHRICLLRLIIRLDEEVRGKFWNLKDVGDPTLLAVLNNPSSEPR
jgi:hypothetical protein